MLNLRQINRKFFLSGGWTNVGEDAPMLRQLNVACVLDLQYTPDQPDFNANAEFTIRQVLEHFDLQYWVIPMFDGPNPDMEKLFQEGYDCIAGWLAEIKTKKILVKCSVGVSRSASMLIYFLCRSQGISFIEGYEIVYGASPNGLYIESTLKDYLKATFPNDAPVSRYNRKYGF